MPATARKIPITKEDLDGSGGGGGGAYAELVVPDDYEATLTDVSDYDKTKQGKSRGWVFEYDVETPSGKSVTFKSWLSFGANARWKLIEVLEAHDADLAEGIADIDPNAFIGDVIGVHIDFPRDKETDEPTSPYREIKQHFSLADMPEEETEFAVVEETVAVEEVPPTEEVVAEAPDDIF